MIGIDDVPWDSVLTTYGSGEQIPQLLKQIEAAGLDQKDAIEQLFDAIVHQGMVQQAAPMVVPFLFDLVQIRTLPHRHLLVGMIQSVAVAGSYDYLPFDFTVEGYKTQCEKNALGLTDSQRLRRAWGPHINLACYDSVEKNSEILLALCKDLDIEVRIESTHAIAWVPGDSATTISHLCEFLSQGVDDPRELANLLLAYGLACYATGIDCVVEKFTPYLTSDILSVRVCAAIGAAWWLRGDQVIEILREGAAADELEAYELNIPFNAAFIQSYARRTLEYLVDTEKVV